MEEKKSLKERLTKEAEESRDSGVKALLGEEEKAIDSLMERAKDKLETGNWLKKARKHELEGDYRKALESYLRFIEARLGEIKADPKATIKDYLALVTYYLKVSECYEKVTHTTAGGKEKDMENAGKYFMLAAEMYLDLEKYDEAFKCYENAARCFGEAESYANAAEAYMAASIMNYKLKKMMISCTCLAKAAEYYEKGGDYLNSSKAYLRGVEINLEIKDVYGAINNYKKVAECYEKMGNPREAIKYHIKSADLSSSFERYSEVADRYEGIAKSYETLEDYENAIFYHNQAATLNHGNNDLAASYNYENAARDFEKLKNYEKAIEQYNRSMNIRANLKQYAEAAKSAYQIARIYQENNDLENAAKYFFQYGEYGASASQQPMTEGYVKSAKISEEIAEKSLKENKVEKAVQGFLEAAKAYDRLSENQSAADLYLRIGNMSMNINYDNAIRYFIEAATRYTSIKDNVKAAECYILAKDYLNAARNYTKYAENQLRSNQFYNAGYGYRRAAESYKKLKRAFDMKDSYTKSVHNFLQYLERADYMKSKDPNINPGNANKSIGECYIELEDTPNAKKYLEKALEYFIENKRGREQTATEAFIKISDADLALKSGEYSRANEFLEKSLELTEKSIKEGNWPQEYVELLESNKERASELLGRLEIKPEVELTVEQPMQSFLSGEVSIKAKIINNSKYKVNNVYFLTNMPHEFSVTKEPETLPEIDPSESKEITIEAKTATPGKYSFAPLEIIYKDKNGNKYMKSSNEIILEVKNA